MALKVFNTLSGKKEEFRPRQEKRVNLFVCGPTVYDKTHIGHARTYVVFDLIARYLKEKGYRVFYLQNITDIDDKIIKRAEEEKVFWKNLSRKFEREYLENMKKLNVRKVTKYARATEHIKEIISQVERLMNLGFAYRGSDGIYYDISKFRDYGKLSKRTVLQAEDAVSRIDESTEKRNKGDFCLWKYAKSLSSPAARSMRKGTYEYEPSWESPFGPGRPGWHIEDTAIAEKYFGPQYDIHGGGRDLIFPHHEAEISQMEAISGKKPMAKYWLHAGFLTINGQKMSKSLGNFITVEDFLKKYSARILRFFILRSYYHSFLDFSEKDIPEIKKQLERIDDFLEKIRKAKINPRIKSGFQISEYEKKFERAMDDDFNTAKALAALFGLINKGNSLISRNKLSKKQIAEILKFLKRIDKILGFIFWGKKAEKIPSPVLKLAREREKFRRAKNWQKADEIRKKIKAKGYGIEDTAKGPKVKKVS